MDTNKVVSINKKKDEYYEKLNEKYNDIEYIENEGKPMKELTEIERYKHRKEIKENGFDPDEELPF
jgi:hypothetical protein